MSAPNRNLLWASIIVDELARSGLRAVCIAPGSRSTPLAVAFAEHPDIQVYSIIDERSAAFFALGLALASERPVAVVCSSGTATANFYPAIIESHYAGVPLLILTADRPPELRDSGANQTVDQVKMYGDHVRWAVDVALPEGNPAHLTIRSLRTLACRAFAAANGMHGTQPKGAVHLNFPFRKPLEPIPVPDDKTSDPSWAGRSHNQPFTRIAGGRTYPSDGVMEALLDTYRRSERPMIVIGPNRDHALADELITLAKVGHMPLLADPLSQARYTRHWREMESGIIGGYDSFLRGVSDWEQPDLILRFGAMPTSQALIDYLSASHEAYQIGFSADGTWKDSNHQIDELIIADPVEIARSLAHFSSDDPRAESVWSDRFTTAEAKTWEIIGAALNENFFDGAVVADAVSLMPDGAALFIGNSLPVRHLDQLARPAPKQIRVFGSRGASGIDGTVSTAAGVSQGVSAPLVLITGDLGFYHDMNGLLTLKRYGIRMVIVVINNDGGGIFQRLPIAQFDPPYTELFRTAHGMTFESVAVLYGLDYAKTCSRADFRTAFERALSAVSSHSTIIEVPTDPVYDLRRRNTILQRVMETVSAL
ncbi:MAG: 2-succinyl-5-enolpyruvyl-6-hydroxy-3-cyclohexene-1-carboxylic-acid synthase [Phototrophicales bacterium]|nr:MAG: 2-succinyl-5-enolpyruvyl-6-hydroxy-3-cyclohexene-1-carboxylic-acid synthase [Phototrophicales bacterium]